MKEMGWFNDLDLLNVLEFIDGLEVVLVELDETGIMFL